MGPADVGGNSGYTSRRSPMTTADCIAAMTAKQEKSTQGMLRRFLCGQRPKDMASRHILRKHYPVSAGRLYFHQAILRRFTVTSVRRAASASPTKSRWDLGAWERTSGDSKRRP